MIVIFYTDRVYIDEINSEDVFNILQKAEVFNNMDIPDKKWGMIYYPETKFSNAEIAEQIKNLVDSELSGNRKRLQVIFSRFDYVINLLRLAKVEYSGLDIRFFRAEKSSEEDKENTLEYEEMPCNENGILANLPDWDNLTTNVIIKMMRSVAEKRKARKLIKS